MKTLSPRNYVTWIALPLMLSMAFPAQAELKLGIHPFKPPSRLIESFTPLAEYLSEKMGEPVTLEISRDYQTHVDRIGKGEIDMAYMGPVLYVKASSTYGSMPLLARQAIKGNPVFHGKIFVRKDSNIRKLSDLMGKRFAFGEEHSTMSHLVPRYMLWQSGIPVEKLGESKFVGDHVNVALGILAGDYDAGAVKEDVYFEYAGRGLREIATSQPLSDHVFVASKKMPAAKVRKLQEILLRIDKDPRGASILGSMTKGVTALVPAKDSDYDSLRSVLRKMQDIGVSY